MVLFALAIADGDLTVFKVEVFDAQVETFHQAQAAPVEQLAHQLVIARETGDDAADLFAREDDRQVRGARVGWTAPRSCWRTSR